LKQQRAAGHESAGHESDWWDSWPAALYNLGSGRWSAWANGQTFAERMHAENALFFSR